MVGMSLIQPLHAPAVSYISFGAVVVKELRLDDSNKILTTGIAYPNAKARDYSKRSAATSPQLGFEEIKSRYRRNLMFFCLEGHFHANP
jgi:hypothetical protein